MQSKYIIGLLVVFAVVAGVWYSQTDKRMTNGDMLTTVSDTKLYSQENLAYFAGALGYFTRPEASGTYPGVVVIHENRGLNAGIKKMADELAKEGYMVLAVDLLGPSVETQDEARALTAKFDQKQGVANMRAAAAYLRSQGATKVASLGWCFGGGQSLQLALSGEPMDATLIYYGRLSTSTDELRKISWPVLGIFGDKDQAISVESVNGFDVALDSLGIENEIYLYPGVGHAFANPSGMNYAPAETMDAWKKTVAFLDRHIGNNE